MASERIDADVAFLCALTGRMAWLQIERTSASARHKQAAAYHLQRAKLRNVGETPKSRAMPTMPSFVLAKNHLPIA
jgi:hypothetical protein